MVHSRSPFANIITFPCKQWMERLYFCKLSSSRCKRARTGNTYFSIIIYNGLWSLLTLIVLPYIQGCNRIQIDTTANSSYSILTYRFSLPVNDLDVRCIRLLYWFSTASRPHPETWHTCYLMISKLLSFGSPGENLSVKGIIMRLLQENYVLQNY